MAEERRAESGNQGIKSIEVGARVLIALERGHGPLSLSEVARLSDLHPAKAHRYLTSLIRTGLAARDPNSGTYDLGPAARRLGIESLRRVDVVRIAAKHAMELRDETGHTVNVAVWSDAGPVLVDWVTGAHTLPIVIRVGSTLPLLDSAVGQVFISFLPRAITKDAVASQTAQGTTRRRSAKEISALRDGIIADGYARTRDQMILGLSALAAPVFNAAGELESVMGLVLPARTKAAEVAALGPQLRQSADRASTELGHQPADT